MDSCLSERHESLYFQFRKMLCISQSMGPFLIVCIGNKIKYGKFVIVGTRYIFMDRSENPVKKEDHLMIIHSEEIRLMKFWTNFSDETSDIYSTRHCLSRYVVGTFSVAIMVVGIIANCFRELRNSGINRCTK